MRMMTAGMVQAELKEQADESRARHAMRFFKTGPGEYGEGDKFLGVRVPEQRKIAKKYRHLPLDEVRNLIRSPYHEERLTGLLILTYRFPKSDEHERMAIFKFYISHTPFVNNWDLVDVTAPKIVGHWLEKRSRKLLYELAGSESVWERRIAMLSTMHFIRNDDLKDTLQLAETLLKDTHDLIHKAVGWMLREAGKKDLQKLEAFLDRHAGNMPRTMLRYAIERLPESRRRYYMKSTA